MAEQKERAGESTGGRNEERKRKDFFTDGAREEREVRGIVLDKRCAEEEWGVEQRKGLEAMLRLNSELKKQMSESINQLVKLDFEVKKFE